MFVCIYMETSLYKITARLETSDHDGYCSGSECEYTSSVVEKVVKRKKGDFNTRWEDFLDHPNVQGNSYYCRVSGQCKQAGLDQHEYRYTVLTVEEIPDVKILDVKE